MHEDFPFLRAIFSQPDDDGLRLIYADWLERRRATRWFLRWTWETAPASEQAARNRQAALAKQMGDLTPKLDARWVWQLGCGKPETCPGPGWIWSSWATARA